MIQDGLVIALQLAIIGMGVVFTALALLVLVLTAFKRVDLAMSKPRPEAIPTPAPGTQPSAPPSVHGIPSEEVAVISAAITAALTRRIQVKRIRYLDNVPETAWSRQGRVTIMASHVTKH
jgi:sodium pump decarboxylase gamma subunit